MTTEGFADLVCTRDLFDKLVHDQARLSAHPSDTYAAFDFFVTAEHPVDWYAPDVTKAYDKSALRASIRDRAEALQVASSIANGAKHFRALKKHHGSAPPLTKQDSGFDGAAFSADSFSADSYSITGLHVELNDGRVVHVLSLANELVEFWRTELAL